MNQRSRPSCPKPTRTPGATRPPRVSSTRRTVLTATLGLAAITIPTRWSSPLIESVVLPAHAQTTGSLTTPLTDCAPQTLTDGSSVAFTLSEAECTTSSNAVAFLGASCAGGVTTLTVAPGVQWDPVSSSPAGNPIVIAAGSGLTPITIVVEQLVTSSFYRMEFDVTDDGVDCSLSEILVFGPFTSAAAATA